MEAKDIEVLRKSIDGIDETILDLINRRLAIAAEIGVLKQKHDADLVDADRENRLIDRLIGLNRGPLNRTDLTRIFREIINASRALQALQPEAHIRYGAADIYTVIGHPVAHSLSPDMLNRAFRQSGINAVYIACDVEDIAAAMIGLRALGFKGASVTIPHKVSVMSHLDSLDETAGRIGAVNTIINVNGRLRGSNTDCLGAVKAIAAQTKIPGKRIFIIGAGGAARAIGFGLIEAGAEITIVNRTPASGAALARDLNADFQPLKDLTRIDGDILINTTPVGMAPKVDESPIDVNLLRRELTVMDIIYNPLQTRLLQAAQKIGCRTVSGLSMFVYQGAAQFELWTGRPAPLAEMEVTVHKALTG